MKLPKFSFWLLLLIAPISLVFLLLLAGFATLVLAFAPPEVSAAAGVILALFVLWLIIRPRSGSTVNTEGALMGRQSSKEGLL